MGYDVFMSFRGEDTRMGFTGHLYKDLTANGIITYRDDKTLETRKPITPELLQAIQTSRIAIVVLSSNFATSKWCLEEIAKIVDCMKRGKLIVIPIFYHVSPSDVRHQSDCFEKGFANHEANPQIAPQKVEAWRDAFKEVGAVSGLHVTQHRDEAEVVSKIVSNISRYLSDKIPIDLPKSLVGIESRVDEVKRMLRMESSEVLFIGICGMSGIGKTTLAEAVYKDIKSEFKKSSLVENIKDISKQNDSTDLCKLQQKLLDDILTDQSVRVQSVIHGQTLLGTKLRGLKVIIVLDDVNHDDQLTYLAGGLEWFGPGSRIIVTTTNRELLNPHIINDIYSCEEMNGDEALSLFCQSAFKQSRPTHGYEKLSDDIVKLAGGLPLALNVYGSLLCGKDENYWKDMLKKLREYPERKVRERLEVGYARLDGDQRDTFMYIACFLKGRNIDLVKDILTNIGLYPECIITDLVNKCLITINLEDNVWMHDLLQQMCWEIIHKESHGKRIAIKYHKDIVDILSSNSKGDITISLTLLGTCLHQGTHGVEIINQEPYMGEVNDCFIDPTCFSKMTKLKFLRISNVHFPKGLKYLSNDLRLLEWFGCSLKSLPSVFEPKHIYELEMSSSQLKTLWKKHIELPNLRSINLSFSKDLTDIPNLTLAPNLVKLNLEGCTSLTRLHTSVLLHKRLRYLNLKGCTCLQSLGRTPLEMESLEVLLLSGCSKLEKIPEFGKNMKRFEHLYVDGTRIKKLPENLGEMCDLRNLDASGTFIEELPSSIYCLTKLRLLHVSRCPLSFKMGCFLNPSLDTLSSGLKEVDLSYCNLLSWTECWIIPEAVFEIVGAGSEIPSGFVQPGSKGLILEGPWIGVAICAVISVNQVDAYAEDKYTVTAHIRLGEKHWKITVPVHFLVAESETQLVFYWTVVDDLQEF
ncbi:disease resistance protein RPV1-like [Bidens hawaiensis]|uniref:disease resistance protein RPV1-like n=1 Tax=Bidens hawaiensis TaxID=980011 RepID=UPI0040492892